jgi:hypothetical protein
MKKAITAISAFIAIIGLNMAGAEADVNQLVVNLSGLVLTVIGGLVVWLVNRRQPGWEINETINRR